MPALEDAIRNELAELGHDMFGFQERGWSLIGEEGQDITAPFAVRLQSRIEALEAALRDA